jgi:t-SNARE complex subunit (syntaxin)
VDEQRSKRTTEEIQALQRTVTELTELYQQLLRGVAHDDGTEDLLDDNDTVVPDDVAAAAADNGHEEEEDGSSVPGTI